MKSKLYFIAAAAILFAAGATSCKKDEAVKVTAITLNKSTTTIIAGESEQLSVAEVTPANATEKGVAWESKNTARATVDETGMVEVPATATAGTVDIVATAKDGSGVTATCTVTVAYGYKYGGEVFEVAWAGYYYEQGSGYCFGISPTVPDEKLFNEENFFEVDMPEDRLGEKLDMSQNCDGEDWGFYGYFYFAGTEYYFEGYDEGVTGSDNWVQVTKNAGTDDFTLEFAMTIDGKRLEGRYSGTFLKYDNYGDVGVDH